MEHRGVSLLLYVIAIPLGLFATVTCGARTDAGLFAGLVESPSPDGGTDGATSCEGGECDGSDDHARPPAEAGEAEVPEGGEERDGGELPPSCRPGGPGMTDCGASREDCCKSLEVTGGTFHRSYLNGGMGPTDRHHEATVSTFRLDKYLVTVGRFRQFVNAWDGGTALPSAGAGKHTYLNGGNGLASSDSPGTYETGWVASDDVNIDPTEGHLTISRPYATWTKTPGDRETSPIDCVNWWEAYAFCIWDDAFLPSETESEYTSAGGSKELEYPWGSADPLYNSQYAVYDCYFPSTNPHCSGQENIAPVGTTTLGGSLWGQLDMSGELNEWTLDWYGTFLDPCTDCARLSSPPDRLIRGGTFSYGATTALLSSDASRGAEGPASRGFIGFRCARAPDLEK